MNTKYASMVSGLFYGTTQVSFDTPRVDVDLLRMEVKDISSGRIATREVTHMDLQDLQRLERIVADIRHELSQAG